jgi:hypothetical protein
MAISSSAVWEVRTTGDDANGGFYVSGGTDYSQQDSAQLSVTDGVTNGTTTVTSATGGFTAAMIGNGINIAGTIRQITARTDTNTITVDATVAAASGQTMKVGGALASPGMAAGKATACNTIWWKSGTYSATIASTNVAGGCVSLTGGSGVTAASYLRGYHTTRWSLTTGPTATDIANKPVLQASGISTATLIAAAGNFSVIDNVCADGASLTAIRGVSVTGASSTGVRLKGINCTNTGVFASGTNVDLYFAEASGCSTQPAISVTDCRMYCLVAHDNTSTGIYLDGVSTSTTASHLLSYNNSGASSVGINANNNRAEIINCTAYNNGSDGFRWAVANPAAAINCLSYGNGAYGFNCSSGTAMIRLFNCAAGSNVSSPANNLSGPQEGFVTLTGDPFTNAASGDFSLNNTAGADCRAAGIPGVFPGGTTIGYPDIGAAQYADAGGPGGGKPRILSASRIGGVR